MVILVSACLLGENCKYNGGNNLRAQLVEWLKKHEVVAVCPEMAGGLPCPRTPAERQGERVVNAEGTDVSEAFWQGAKAEILRGKAAGAKLAILMSRSPSCGVGKIYDGSFRSVLTEGNGVFAELAAEEGIHLLDAADFEEGLADKLVQSLGK